jgi:hypothetical protein
MGMHDTAFVIAFSDWLVIPICYDGSLRYAAVHLFSFSTGWLRLVCLVVWFCVFGEHKQSTTYTQIANFAETGLWDSPAMLRRQKTDFSFVSLFIFSSVSFPFDLKQRSGLDDCYPGPHLPACLIEHSERGFLPATIVRPGPVERRTAYSSRSYTTAPCWPGTKVDRRHNWISLCGSWHVFEWVVKLELEAFEW